MTINYTDGRTETHADYAAACEAILAEYPDAAIGHSGDIIDGGDRTLVWIDEETARDDDGSAALASIERGAAVAP